MSKIEMVIVTFLAVFNITNIVTGAAFRQSVPEVSIHLVATVILSLWAFRSLRGWTRSSKTYNTEYRMLRRQLEVARKRENPSAKSGFIGYRNESRDVPIIIIGWHKRLWWTSYELLVVGKYANDDVAELTRYSLPIEEGYVKRSYSVARWEDDLEREVYALFGESVEPAGIITELVGRRLWKKENPELYAASCEDLSQLRSWLARV